MPSLAAHAAPWEAWEGPVQPSSCTRYAFMRSLLIPQPVPSSAQPPVLGGGIAASGK